MRCRSQSLPSTSSVFSRRDGFEVCRVDAGRRNAQMVDVVTRRDNATSQLVRKSVCCHQSLATPKRAVARAVVASRPQPAITGLIDFRPESFFGGYPDQDGRAGLVGSVVVLCAHTFGVTRRHAAINRTRRILALSPEPRGVVSRAHLPANRLLSAFYARTKCLRLGQPWSVLHRSMAPVALIMDLTKTVTEYTSCATLNNAVANNFYHDDLSVWPIVSQSTGGCK